MYEVTPSLNPISYHMIHTNLLGWPQFFFIYHEGTLQLPWKLILLVKTVTSTGRSASPSFLTVKSISLSASLSPRSTKSGDKVMLTTTGQLQ